MYITKESLLSTLHNLKCVYIYIHMGPKSCINATVAQSATIPFPARIIFDSFYIFPHKYLVSMNIHIYIFCSIKLIVYFFTNTLYLCIYTHIYIYIHILHYQADCIFLHKYLVSMCIYIYIYIYTEIYDI